MSSRTLTVDAAASKILIHTRAEGLLARLAHDLELRVRSVEGKVSLDGDAWTAELSAPVSGIEVVGVLRGDAVDEGALSSSDRADIKKKMQTEVLTAPAVVVKASGASRASGEATVEVGSGRQRVSFAPKARETEAGGFVVEGRFAVSLGALGIKPPKGPLGAFRVNDEVEILYSLSLSPA